MNHACRKTDCTVLETGVCLLNSDPTTCPERLPVSTDLSRSTTTIDPPLSAPARNPKFPSSLTLTPEAVREASGDRAFRLIGILGAPDAGKTAILVSLYLLLSTNKLSGFKFADSMSLFGLDETSRGARQWNKGQPPDQMTSHTELLDHRTPGFLHLRLRDKTSGARQDLLLPDLPGEWSTSLIDSNRVDRLEFLKSADVIWITIDGRQLIETAQYVIHRTVLLFERLARFLGPGVPPLLVVISHKDFGEPSKLSLDTLKAEAVRLKLSINIVQVASFSQNPQIEPGTGIAELIDISLRNAVSRSAFWPDSGINGDREFSKLSVERPPS
jgi:hypothetical protein